MIYLLLIFQQFIASTTHIFAKNLTFELPPGVILLLRSFFAVLFFILLLILRKQKLFVIQREDFYKFVVLGILNIPLNQYLFFVSIKFTTAPNVALAYALSPIFILIIAVAFFREKADLIKVIGIIVAFFGISIILIEKGVSFKSEYFVGNLLALVASICWALYSTYGKSLIKKYGSIYTTAMAMTFGFILYLPISLAQGDFEKLNIVHLVHLAQILYLAVMTSGLAYLIWYHALKRLPASNVGVFNNLQPVFTTILAVIFFHQKISAIYIVGGLMVIIGVILTQRNHADEESRKE
jgi:drug/metabolite transporter (DMT)-like permease